MSFFLRLEPEAQKLRGPAVAYNNHAILHKKPFFWYRALCSPIETSARLSQETRTEKLRCWEAEMPRSWDAELLRSESARNSIHWFLLENSVRRVYGSRKILRSPYSIVWKVIFWGGFSMPPETHFFRIFGAAGAENQVLGVILERLP